MQNGVNWPDFEGWFAELDEKDGSKHLIMTTKSRFYGRITQLYESRLPSAYNPRGAYRAVGLFFQTLASPFADCPLLMTITFAFRGYLNPQTVLDNAPE